MCTADDNKEMLAEDLWQRRYYYVARVEISVYLSYFRKVRLPTTLMLEVDGRDLQDLIYHLPE